MPRSRPRVGVAVAALTLFFVGLVYVLPVHVSVTTEGEPSLLVGETVAERADAVPQRTQIEVVLLAGDPLTVEQIVDGAGVPVRLPAPEGWTAGDGSFATGEIERPLVIDSSFRLLSLSIRSIDGGASSVGVIVDGGPVRELAVQGAQPVPVQVESGMSVVTTSTRFGFRSVDVAPAAAAGAWLGPLPLDIDLRPDGSPVVTAGSIWTTVLGGVWSAANVVGVAVALVVAFLVIGWAMLGRSVDQTDPYVALALGAAFPALLLGALNYLLPVRSAVPIVAAGLVSLIGWRCWRTGQPIRRSVDDLRALIVRSSVGWPILLATLFVGLPAALTDNINLGMLQTDIFNYLTVQQAYWTSNIVESGLDWGDGLRSIDSSVRAATIGWTHLSEAEGFNAVRFATIVVAITTVGGACRALGARPSVVPLVQLGLLSLASVQSLWVEGYLSREMFVWIAIPSLAVPMRVLGGEAAERLGNWLALGVIFAWPAALVPPFMVTLLTPAVGLLVMVHAQGWATARARAVAFSAAFLGLLIPNSRWVINIDKANEYAQAVELIGKQFVVPFHADPEFPAAAIGLTGFHTNPLSWQGPRTLDGIGGPFAFALRILNAMGSSWTAVVVACAVLVVAAVAMWHQVDPMLRPRLAALLSPGLAVALAVPLLIDTSWETQSFFVLMWVWTMSAFLLAPILIGASVLRGRAGLIVGLPLGVLIAINLASSGLEMAMWFSHPQAGGAGYHHFDAAADVLAIEDLLDSGELAPADYVVEEPFSVTSRDDDNRVLNNHLALRLEGDGASCLNCVWDPRNGSVAGVDAEASVQAERVLVVGANRCVTGEPLYEGVLVALCQRVGETDRRSESAAPGD